MTWLLLLKTMLDTTASVTKWMGDKQLLKAGAAEKLSEILLKERDRVQEAITAGRNVKLDADSVRDDKNNRS